MKVLVIGLGSIAKKHITALNKIGQFQIYALRSNINASVYENVINVYELNPIISEIDFVIISNPTHLHYESINQLINFNKPLFIEKPSLHNLNKAEELIEKIKINNIITYIACNLRFNPVLMFLKENAVGKIINEVNVYCGSYLPDWRPQVNFREVYSANSELGGGVHLDLYHEIDYLTWIVGMPQKSTAYFANKSSLNITAFDYANYVLKYSTYTASVILNYYRKDIKRSIELVFDNDTWYADIVKGTVTDMNANVIFQTSETTIDTYPKQLSYFIECLKKNKNPMNNFEESVEKLKICLSEKYER